MLLILDVLVCGEEYFEPIRLGSGQKNTIRKFGPPHAGRMGDVMTGQQATKPRGNILINQDLQAG